MTRQAKTPRQRAEEALAVEERRVKRLAGKERQLRDETDAISRELATARTRRDYLKQHPDLANDIPRPTRTTIQENK